MTLIVVPIVKCWRATHARVHRQCVVGCSLVCMAFVRVLLGALVALLVVIVVVPAVALLDLVVGGTGLGLCPTGLGTCSTSIFTLLELVAVLGGIVVIVGASIVACLHALGRMSGVRS